MKTAKTGGEPETLRAPAAALLILYAFFRRDVLLFAALALLGCGIFFKRLSSRLAWAWLGFSALLGALLTRLLLTLVYFLCLTPAALLFRLFNKDPLEISMSRKGSSFHRRERRFTPADLENPW